MSNDENTALSEAMEKMVTRFILALCVCRINYGKLHIMHNEGFVGTIIYGVHALVFMDIQGNMNMATAGCGGFCHIHIADLSPFHT